MSVCLRPGPVEMPSCCSGIINTKSSSSEGRGSARPPAHCTSHLFLSPLKAMTFFYFSLIRFLTSTGTFFPAERVFPSLFTQFAPRLVSKTSSDLLPTRSNLSTKRSHSTVPPDYTCNFPSICVIFKIQRVRLAKRVSKEQGGRINPTRHQNLS